MRIVYLFLVMLFYSVVISAPQGSSKIHPDLRNKMNSAMPNEKIPIMIIFNSHLTLNDFNDIGYDTPKKERRQIVVERLLRYSDQSQRNVRLFIDAKKSAGVINDFEVLWIINRIALKTDVNTINDLSSDFSEILMLTYDPSYPVEELYDSKQYAPPFIQAAVSPQAIEPGITLMNADDCWLQGNREKVYLLPMPTMVSGGNILTS